MAASSAAFRQGSAVLLAERVRPVYVVCVGLPCPALLPYRAMTKTLDSTAVYAYTTLISMIVCLPFAIGMEGGALQAGAAAAIQKVGGARRSRQHKLVAAGLAWGQSG